MTQKKKIFFDESFDFPFFKFNKQYNLMKSDILEKEDGFKIIIDMPGFKKENIKIITEDNYLSVYAERVEEEEEGLYLHNERYYGKVSRSYYVGKVNKENVTASYKNGILELFIPKEDEEEIKTINIE